MSIKHIISGGGALLLFLGVGLFMFSGCENDHSVKGDEFYLSPGSYRFVRSSDTVVSIGAHGGVPPLRWYVSDAGLGQITGAPSGTNLTYTSTANYERVKNRYGVNTVTVRDARGWQAICTITVANGLDSGEAGGSTPGNEKNGGNENGDG